MTDAALHQRLLGLVLGDPKRALVLALATGMVVAQGLVAKRRRDVLDALGRDDKLIERAAVLIIDHWAARMQIGSIDHELYIELLDDITRLARSS